MCVVAMETQGAESFHASYTAGKLVTLPAITSIATTLGSKVFLSLAFTSAQPQSQPCCHHHNRWQNRYTTPITRRYLHLSNKTSLLCLDALIDYCARGVFADFHVPDSLVRRPGRCRRCCMLEVRRYEELIDVESVFVMKALVVLLLTLFCCLPYLCFVFFLPFSITRPVSTPLTRHT